MPVWNCSKRLGKALELPGGVAAGDVHRHRRAALPPSVFDGDSASGIPLQASACPYFRTAIAVCGRLHVCASIPAPLLVQTLRIASSALQLDELSPRYEYPEEIVPAGATHHHLREPDRAGLRRALACWRAELDVSDNIRTRLRLIAELKVRAFLSAVARCRSRSSSRGIL